MSFIHESIRTHRESIRRFIASMRIFSQLPDVKPWADVAHLTSGSVMVHVGFKSKDYVVS